MEADLIDPQDTMNPLNRAPLVYFRVLADLQGKSAGLLIDIGAGDAQAVLELIGTDRFGTLAAHFPAVYRAGIDPALAAALAAAQWTEVAEGTVFRTDDKLVRESVPPGALWVDGNWCMAPPAKAQGAQAASRGLALQLVQLVAADADTHEIEALLRHDATLSYHLLRLVNSLGMGAGRKVNSFSQAILILGRQQLRRWLNLMLFAARQNDVRSAMLLARVAARARCIELLAKARGLDKSLQEQGFMTGMFSLLGVLFGMPLAEVLAPLAISDAVNAALLGHEGELGAMRALVEAAESGELDAAAGQLAALQLAEADFNAAVVEAHVWMLDTVRDTHGTAP